MLPCMTGEEKRERPGTRPVDTYLQCSQNYVKISQGHFYADLISVLFGQVYAEKEHYCIPHLEENKHGRDEPKNAVELSSLRSGSLTGCPCLLYNNS